jgi:thiazole synthase
VFRRWGALNGLRSYPWNLIRIIPAKGLTGGSAFGSVSSRAITPQTSGGAKVTVIDSLDLGGHAFTSRLLMGTGKFSSIDGMVQAIEAAGAQLVTVALRRFNRENPADDLVAPLSRLGVTLMPNTSGARTADEAVRAALLAREMSGSPFVKVEIHPNPHHLMPDPIETHEACKVLVKEGFVVLPYMPADPVLAKRLEDLGCAAVMPLGSGIGTGHGLATREMLRLIIAESGIPVIVDAGLRSPSEAAAAMELGCAAVLVNSAIAAAGDPAGMARAFAGAVQAGYDARKAGLMTRSELASPTSPLTSFLTGSR